jgi:hypothetical protein
MARPSEKTIQQAIVDLACGSKVSPGLGFYRYSTSQYRASHVSEGLPDLILFQVKAGIALWWETKSYDGKLWKRGTVALQPLSPMQERFRLHCRSTGELHGWGALPEFYLMLLLLGFAQVSEGGSLILNPRGDARHVIRS